jgi:hypothetical protein
MMCPLSTSYTTAAAYGSNPNVFIRLDNNRNRGGGGEGSVASGGSYATIASFQKISLSAPAPYYSTPLINGKLSTPINTKLSTPIHAVYAAPSSPASSAHIYCRPHCPSRTSYYASSQISMNSKVRFFVSKQQ